MIRKDYVGSGAKHSTIKRAAVMAAVAVLFGTPAAWAATINWGAPTTISADTDVSTAGSLVAALNVGNAAPGSPTINTVPFTAFGTGTTSGTATSGQFTLTTGVGEFLVERRRLYLGRQPVRRPLRQLQIAAQLRGNHCRRQPCGQRGNRADHHAHHYRVDD